MERPGGVPAGRAPSVGTGRSHSDQHRRDLNGVFFAQSGAPFTVNLGIDRANIGAGPAQRPARIRDPNLPASERTAERWFDTSAFALPAPFTFGTAPRSSVIGR